MNIGIDARAAYKNFRGGFGTYIYNLVNKMVKISHSHTLNLYLDGTNEVPIPKSKNILPRILKFPFPFLWTQIRLPISLIKYSPDIFLFPSQTIASYVPCTSIVTIHDLGFKKTNTRSLLDNMRIDYQTKKCISISDRIIAVSNNTKEDLIENYSVPPDKITVIPHGCDHIYSNKRKINKSDLLKKYGIKYPYILSLGYLMPQKNIPRLVDAFALFKRESQLPHSLVIAGPRGPDEKRVQHHIIKNKLENNVKRVNYIDHEDLFSLYKYSALFIYPSLYEGFGFPILEAMASGTPVITSNISSLPEIAGDAAVLINPYEITHIASALMDVVINDKLRNTNIEKGYKRAKRFTWQKTAEKTLSLINSLVN